MKKRMLLGLLPLVLLVGCGSQETFETVSDELVQTVMASPRSISVRLPDEAVAPVLESDSQQVYLCEDYEITLENLSSGDLNETIRHLTGFERDALTVMQTSQGDVDRYEFVWVSAGEEGDRLGRAVILDDGNYHYCMSVLRDAVSSEDSQILWEDVFASFCLTESFIRTD